MLSATEPRAVFTDDNGRYEIARLSAGRYTMMAMKAGFVTSQYGQRRPFGAGRSITLVDGQTIEKVDITMSPGAAVSGRIVDEFGEPVAGAAVEISRLAFANGRRQLNAVGSGGTDDRGEYRIFGLDAGEYFVRATLSLPSELSGASLGYAPTYYPGTAARNEAQRISLRTGEEMTGIAFALGIAKTARISGIVRNRDGSPVAVAFVAARDNSGDAGSIVPDVVSVTRPDGSFVLNNASPGSYVVQATTAGDTRLESPPANVVINGRDVDGLVLEIGTSATARGRISFDTKTPPGDLRRDLVRVFPVSPDSRESSFGTMPSPPRSDWTFEIANLTGRRLLRLANFRDDEWTMKSVMLEGVDVIDTPIDFSRGDVDGIEIVLTQRKTDLSGRVADGRDIPSPGSTVVAFVDDPEKWGPYTRFVERVQTDQDGRFRLRGLPPARYVVVALDDLEPGEEGDVELLERLRPKGIAVSLHESEARSVDLKITEF
jgi:hypothetical protein